MKIPVKGIGFAVVLGTICAVSQTFAAGWVSDAVQSLDTDHDGTIDMNEARKAATAAFDGLDRDHDGMLSACELRGRMSARELAAEDQDHDGTLTKDKYAASRPPTGTATIRWTPENSRPVQDVPCFGW